MELISTKTNFRELENFAFREDLFSRMSCLTIFREDLLSRIGYAENFHEYYFSRISHIEIFRKYLYLRIDCFQFFADTYFRESDSLKLFVKINPISTTQRCETINGSLYYNQADKNEICQCSHVISIQCVLDFFVFTFSNEQAR